MHHDQRVGTLRRRCLSTALSKLVAILALVLSVVWCAHAQQPDDVQKHIQQLNEQFEDLTQILITVEKGLASGSSKLPAATGRVPAGGTG